MIKKYKAIFRIWFCGKSFILFFLLIVVFGWSIGLSPQNRSDEYRVPVKLKERLQGGKTELRYVKKILRGSEK